MVDKQITIYVISDSIGETGELIARAAIRQFVSNKYEIRRYPYIQNEEQIKEIFSDAKNGNSLVLYTTVSEKTRDYIHMQGIESNIPTIDIMTPPLKALEKILGYPPKRESGIIRRLDENYFRKVEAVEFAVKYDDGKDTRGIKKADICLVGVSRTSKTPLSMYLAHKNFKVANVPLVPEVLPPDELFQKDKRRVIGLVADPYKLNEIRQERLKTLGLNFTANYANVDRINAELEYSRDIMKKLGCIVIDVSNSAIEETAGIIIDHMTKNFGERILL
ncbi:pyruvate, water dikinase regulatory protein [Wansuia hejianensis]|uniref:Putative pyruvate, phosphate dikinase regulatory protein n=1 Tax=Wansuia hejianensis TaxID=2763667 RepID=A0A926EXG5_9FIRM|nr:pyruvate, water dikinase regulatory protein [Wansuia hejianensis]MBC8590756.1 kinase/pyrophosphorylase [Wansuia hejianensis]